MQRLLLIDDDPELTALLSTYLGNEGFAVEFAHTGAHGLQRALEESFSAIVLDIMLPELNGIEVLKQLRQQRTTPVIMLTGKGDDLDRILGLELGADDYLPKPCNPRELLARLRAVLRRTTETDTPKNNAAISTAGALQLHTAQRKILLGNNTLELTKAEYEILKCLIDQKNTVVDKQSLYQNALGRPFEAYDRSLDMHISNLRKKMAQHSSKDIICNVRGVGYQVSD